MWGNTAALRACAKFHGTLSSKRHFPPQGTQGFRSGEKERLPQLQEWRKEIILAVLQDSRLKWAHVRRDLEYLRLEKGSYICEVSRATKWPSE